LPRVSEIGAPRGRFALLGFGVTFLGVFVSATGTLLSPFIAGASPDRRNHVATYGAVMAIVHLCKMVAFGVIGIAIGAYLPLAAAMIAATFAGNLAGRRTLDHVPEHVFRIVFRVILTLLALRLMWVAAREAGLF
jgi:uncharacterized membrane protein YfcA